MLQTLSKMPEDFKTYINVFEARSKRIAIEYSFAKGFEVFVLLISLRMRMSNLFQSLSGSKF